jgi:hypothetical protein
MATQQFTRLNDIGRLQRVRGLFRFRNYLTATSTVLLVLFVVGVSSITDTEAYKTRSSFFVKRILRVSRNVDFRDRSNVATHGQDGFI